MEHYQDVKCPKCGGACFVDDRYDAEIGKWLQKPCEKCDGLGYVSIWTEDD